MMKRREEDIIEADARKTSITCPICGYMNKNNRADKETFKCGRRGFTFNAQYVVYLNLFSRSDDSKVAIMSERLYLIHHKADQVVPIIVAPR